MSNRPSAPNSVERRINRALSHVEDYWIPVNPNLFRKLSQDLTNLESKSEIDQFVSSIESDIGLHSWCLRENLIRAGDDASTAGGLRSLSAKELQQIFPKDLHTISNHDLHASDDLQLSRLRESLLSAASAEQLSEHFMLEPEQAHAAALLRSLGLNLIAWNYPTVYRRAVTEMAMGASLDLTLTKQLGFSPHLLAVRLLERWGVKEHQLESYGLSADGEIDDDLIADGIANSLAELCRIGEALARANEPSVYPSARHDWEEAQSRISEILGPNGIEQITQRFRELADSYVTFMPELFQVGTLFPVPIMNIASSEDGVISDSWEDGVSEGYSRAAFSNPYLEQCGEPCRTVVQHYLTKNDPLTGRRYKLQQFMQEVFPSFGFPGLAIFTLDPGVCAFIPQLWQGQLEHRQRSTVEYSIALADADPVSIAYRSHEAVIQYHHTKDNQISTSIASVLGRTQRVGVVYAEISAVVKNHYDDPQLVHFLALRWELERCIGLL